ncbi:clavaminate synthase-like protein At3g21360 [Magnolia sinica]|uniref:clavaminate synthase-like protein At3g21360 n=1 Tax=Magnolia sinica TaxID=86752 RepID=UPI0026589D67|nr:clavaminate synthase-like protein At3g21360 [Magnolia sinica]
MGFVEGKIVEEKVFKGKVFPKTLLPCNRCDLIEMVRGEREQLTDLLLRHGAILFRGFGVSSAEEFSRVVEAFEWDDMPYMGAAIRAKVVNRIFTANDSPLDQLIYFHHEMSLFKEFPSKIFFFCLEPSPEGSQTSILPSYIVVEKMEELMAEFVAKLAQVGLTFRLRTVNDADSGDIVKGKTWKELLKTNDKVEAEKRALESIACDAMEFHSDGSADFIFGPLDPIKELGGKRVWFKPMLGYTGNEKDVHISFGDGSPFPPKATEAYKKISVENSVDLSWQKGDVLLVDNLMNQHARQPGKQPRTILVSLCK